MTDNDALRSLVVLMRQALLEIKDIANRVAAIEAREIQNKFIAFGQRGPHGKIWAAGYVPAAVWTAIAGAPGVVKLSAPCDIEDAAALASAFNREPEGSA